MSVSPLIKLDPVTENDDALAGSSSVVPGSSKHPSTPTLCASIIADDWHIPVQHRLHKEDDIMKHHLQTSKMVLPKRLANRFTALTTSPEALKDDDRTVDIKDHIISNTVKTHRILAELRESLGVRKRSPFDPPECMRSIIDGNAFSKANQKTSKTTDMDKEYLMLKKWNRILERKPRTRVRLIDAPFVRNKDKDRTVLAKLSDQSQESIFTSDALYNLIQQRKKMLERHRDELLYVTVEKMSTVTRKDRENAYKELAKEIRRGPYFGQTGNPLKNFLAKHDLEKEHKTMTQHRLKFVNPRFYFFSPKHLMKAKLGEYPHNRKYIYPVLKPKDSFEDRQIPPKGTRAPPPTPSEIFHRERWYETMGFNSEPFTYWNVETYRTDWNCQMSSMKMYDAHLQRRFHEIDDQIEQVRHRLRAQSKED